ncbi:MAG: hypothetical protein KAS90_03330 [Candidatus Aenigmarchaeota archaeon]|nr:hypothetical protein [Candidatus Aenigmarchaeota archaeon]
MLRAKYASIAQLIINAKVSRKSIYEILDKLLDKGLISYTIRDNKKQFTAANPLRLLDIIKEKQSNLETLLNS